LQPGQPYKVKVELIPKVDPVAASVPLTLDFTTFTQPKVADTWHLLDQTTATLNARIIKANEAQGEGWFELGTDPDNLTSAGDRFAFPVGSSELNTSYTAANLQQGVTYYYRAVAQLNGDEKLSYGPTQSFVAGASVRADITSNVPTSRNSALLHGSVTTDQPDMVWWFEWSDAQLNHHETEKKPIGVGPATNVSHVLDGLQPGSTYTYRLLTQQSAGGPITYSAPGRFTTIADTPITPPTPPLSPSNEPRTETPPPSSPPSVVSVTHSLNVLTKKASVAKGRFGVNLRCISLTQSACSTTVRLVTAAKHKGRQTKVRSVVISSAKVKVPANKTQTVRVKLNKEGRRLLMKKSRLQTDVLLTFQSLQGTTVRKRQKITLYR
jgi:hypothetical protein